MPSSNKYETFQSVEREVLAERMVYNNAGNYTFYKNGKTVASYPIQYTMVEHIDYDVE